MRDLKDRGAVVTGGASGIGLALGRALLEAGMKVALLDIERAPLEAAVKSLGNLGDIRGIVCDVSDRAAMAKAAQEAIAALGKVHVLCNNAGVACGGSQEQVPYDDWDWVLGVNLCAVIAGVREFLPHIKAHGEGGHVVNTASMAGMISPPGMGPYAATKFAVVALTEGLAAELDGSGIGATALCPGWVKTRINESGRARPDRFGAKRPVALAGMAADRAAQINEAINAGMDPAEVAARVVDAIRNNHLYVFTHPQMKIAVEDRFKRILAAFDRPVAAKT